MKLDENESWRRVLRGIALRVGEEPVKVTGAGGAEIRAASDIEDGEELLLILASDDHETASHDSVEFEEEEEERESVQRWARSQVSFTTTPIQPRSRSRLDGQSPSRSGSASKSQWKPPTAAPQPPLAPHAAAVLSDDSHYTYGERRMREMLQLGLSSPPCANRPLSPSARTSVDTIARTSFDLSTKASVVRPAVFRRPWQGAQETADVHENLTSPPRPRSSQRPHQAQISRAVGDYYQHSHGGASGGSSILESVEGTGSGRYYGGGESSSHLSHRLEHEGSRDRTRKAGRPSTATSTAAPATGTATGTASLGYGEVDPGRWPILEVVKDVYEHERQGHDFRGDGSCRSAKKDGRPSSSASTAGYRSGQSLPKTPQVNVPKRSPSPARRTRESSPPRQWDRAPIPQQQLAREPLWKPGRAVGGLFARNYPPPLTGKSGTSREFRERLVGDLAERATDVAVEFALSKPLATTMRLSEQRGGIGRDGREIVSRLEDVAYGNMADGYSPAPATY